MELVDLYDENRLPLGKTAVRYSKREKGTYRLIVHICIFDGQGRLLIQRRARQKRLWPDKWDVSAAGGVSAGETTRIAAAREVAEELGLPLDLNGVRAVCTVNFATGFDDYYVLRREVDLSSLRLQPEEVSDVRWATRSQVLAMVRRGEFISYPESFLSYLFDASKTQDFPTK